MFNFLHCFYCNRTLGLRRYASYFRMDETVIEEYTPSNTGDPKTGKHKDNNEADADTPDIVISDETPVVSSSGIDPVVTSSGAYDNPIYSDSATPGPLGVKTEKVTDPQNIKTKAEETVKPNIIVTQGKDTDMQVEEKYEEVSQFSEDIVKVFEVSKAIIEQDINSY